MNRKLLLIILCFLFCTQMRTALTFLMPFSLILSAYLFKITLNTKVLLLYILLFVSSFVSVISGFIDIENSFLFCWLVMPILLLQFGGVHYSSSPIKWEVLIFTLTIFVLIIDFIGLVCLVIYQTPDEYGRGYGSHFKGVSGLAVVNSMISFYYLSKFLFKRYNRKDIIFFLMLFISMVLCFSALTLITYLLTILIYFLYYFKFRRFIRFVPFIMLSILLLIYSGQNIYEYNKHNIELLMDSDIRDSNARKVVMFEKAFSFCKESPILIATCGCGPAGYNSRTCFLLNNDSENLFTSLLGHHMPLYHSRDIYPLWNKSFVSVDAYTDGARNKPFSSLVALWIELGLIFFVLFCFFWIKRIFEYRKKAYSDSDYLFLFFLNVFFFLLLVTEYWLESSEYVLFLLLQGSLLNSKIRKKIKKIKIETISLSNIESTH